MIVRGVAPLFSRDAGWPPHVTVAPGGFDRRLPVVTRTPGVWVWPLILIVVIGAGVLYLFFRLVRRFRRRGRTA